RRPADDRFALLALKLSRAGCQGNWAVEAQLIEGRHQRCRINRSAFSGHQALVGCDAGKVGAGRNVSQTDAENLLAAKGAELVEVAASNPPVPGVEKQTDIVALNAALQQQERINLVNELKPAIRTVSRRRKKVQRQLYACGG